VIEDLLDHYRIFNTGNHLHGAAADTAGLDVDVEYTFEALCPGHRGAAEANLQTLVAHYEKQHSHLANWLAEAVPEGLTVFGLPETHRQRMRTSNSIERSIQQELKRRTQLVRVFPHRESLLRLASAILIEIDEEWSNADRRYIVWDDSGSTC
jgi:transposase-like protein